MKFKWNVDFIKDDERSQGGWVFVDLMIPDPFFNKGYGIDINIMTKTKTYRKNPGSKEIIRAGQELKKKMLVELKATVKALKV